MRRRLPASCAWARPDYAPSSGLLLEHDSGRRGCCAADAVGLGAGLYAGTAVSACAVLRSTASIPFPAFPLVILRAVGMRRRVSVYRLGIGDPIALDATTSSRRHRGYSARDSRASDSIHT